MADRPITANEWRDYEITCDVPADALLIEFGFVLVGEGKAWLDAVSIDAAENK